MFTLDVKFDGSQSSRDYGAIFNDVINEYARLVPKGPPLGYKRLEIKKGQKPLCVVNYLPEYYQIVLKLDVDIRVYAQAAYQFSHELCHIYCDPRITNNRFIESICELSSLYFLEYLSKKWETKINQTFRSYAHNFLDYKNRIIYDINRESGEYADIKNITKNTDNIDSDNERNLQLITADKLLPLFKGNSEAWQLIEYFGNFSEPRPKDCNETAESNGIDWEKLRHFVPHNLDEILGVILKAVRGD